MVRISYSIAAMTALAALGLTACATTTETVDIAEARAAGATCKLVQSGDYPEGVVLCGDTEQWAEFDRRATLVNAGVTCDWAPLVGRQLCMTGEQWEDYDRRVRELAQVRRGGSMAGDGANFGVPMVTESMAIPRSGR